MICLSPLCFVKDFLTLNLIDWLLETKLTSVTFQMHVKSMHILWYLNIALFTCTGRTVQLNCCGATGPQDYLYSAWFNHTRDFTGVFVPSTCCHLLAPADPLKPQVKDENLCQVEAIIVLRDTKRPITQLHTKVHTHCNLCKVCCVASRYLSHRVLDRNASIYEILK